MLLDPRDIVSGLLAVIGTYFWYDKTRVTSRLDSLEERQRSTEATQRVLETKIDGIKEMLDVKFSMVMTAVENRNGKENS